MVLPKVSPNDPPEAMIAVINQIVEFINQYQQLQSVSDANDKRYVNGLLPGRWPGGDFGMAISKPGEDVTTANFEDLLFAWDYTTNTQYWNYNGVNYRQDGTLPDGTGGTVITKPGRSVTDVFN